MASNALPNVWYHRRVADSAAKSCWVCFKPSSSVLITPDKKDFFYICPGHLKDRGFATPDADEVAALEAKKKQAELDKAIEELKQEYEEKKKRKEQKRKEKEKDGKGKDKKEKDKEKEKEQEEDKKDEQERDEKIKALTKDEAKPEDGPRIYSLQKSFYQQRVDRIRNAEAAKRNRERINNPSTFPTVPAGNP